MDDFSSVLNEQLTSQKMADVLGITPQRLRQLEKEHWIKSAGRNSYVLGDTVAGYIKFWKNRRQSGQHVDRLSEQKVKLLELQIIEKKGELVASARAEALSVCDEIIGALKVGLDAIPARVSRDICIRQAIEREFDAVFEEFTRNCARLAVNRSDL